MQFEFATVNRIVFGAGVVGQVGGLAREMGRHALVAAGGSPEAFAGLIERLSDAGVEAIAIQVTGEPSVQQVQQGAALAEAESCDLVIGFGGGSAIDTGKAIAALLANPGDIFDYLEVVGRGKPLSNPSLPFIAIPTTAGTGAEVTRNAVLGVPEAHVKASLRSPTMLPRLALIDPELTYSLPPDVTASTGLDALTQLIEPFVSNKANPITDAICREGMRLAAGALLRAYRQGSDPDARRDMSLASLMGGLALANAKLGAVHGFAAPLGGMYPAPHGAVCARVLPFVMETNLRVLREAEPGSEALGETMRRFKEVAQILTGDPRATPEAGVDWVKELVQAVDIPSLRSYGLTPAEFPEVVEKAAQASSMQGNPVKLSTEDLHAILAQAW